MVAPSDCLCRLSAMPESVQSRAAERRAWTMTEYRRHEEQCGAGGEDQAADHRAAERRILLAAFAHAERHRRHADDHRQRRHQHRTEADESGIHRRGERIGAFAQRSRAKLTTRMLFAVATPMHMIAPVSAGTEASCR